MSKVKKLCATAIGIAMFVVLSYVIRFPVFENYYLCLGYIAAAVYCYSFGTLCGTAVGFFGVVLYCLLINGLRGMPGWALGNIVITVALGIAFALTKKISRAWLRWLIVIAVIAASCAVGILGVKSVTEWLIYSQPVAVRIAKNVYAFAADAFVLIVAYPICPIADRLAKRILGVKAKES